MKKISARRMTFEEVAELPKGATVLVPVFDRRTKALVPAALNENMSDSARKILAAGVPSGQSIPSLLIQNMYGSMYSVGANEIYAASELEGEPFQQIETVGTQVSLTLYAPDMEGPDVLARARAALRKEFGPGILQLRQETHQPVSESGLPPVLGVPEGQIPRPI